MSPDLSSLDVWVLAGQSNMEGIARFEGALPPDERVWCFSSAGSWEVAREPLHKLWEAYTPVHLDLHRPGLPPEQQGRSDAELAAMIRESRPRGAGLGMAFGQRMAEELGRPVGLIPAAHGGASLEQWSPARKGEGTRSLYGAMLDRIERAGGRLRGVLWYQGESDATEEWGPTYGERLAEWIGAVREDTGKPELPVAVVQIGRLITDPDAAGFVRRRWNQVQDALAQLPRRVPHTAATSALDLGLGDSIHLDTPGLIRLGYRLARLALGLTEKPEYGLGPRVEAIRGVEAYGGLGGAELICSGVTGAWRPQHHQAGFSVSDAEGQPIAGLQVINADRDPEDPTAIRLLLTRPAEKGACVAYGQGFDPYLNVRDEADMPLCGFMPRPLD